MSWQEERVKVEVSANGDLPTVGMAAGSGDPALRILSGRYQKVIGRAVGDAGPYEVMRNKSEKAAQQTGRREGFSTHCANKIRREGFSTAERNHSQWLLPKMLRFSLRFWRPTSNPMYSKNLNTLQGY